ncbi:MAG: adenylate/guanylate cyclase domain-containing protein [Gammaproteobacteria bacterium]|nr:adenylate/guanylate cyclase domain-containing protein [Gammaproteobacteria bacterium]
MKRTLIRLGVSAVLFVVFLLHTGEWMRFRLLDTLENFTYDARVLLTLPNTVDPRIVIVDADEKSLAEVGQWPWPRDRFAQLLAILFDHYRVKAVGFDFTYPEPDGKSPHRVLADLAQTEIAALPGFQDTVGAMGGRLDYDQQMADAIRGKPVVLGYYFIPRLLKDAKPRTGGICSPVLDRGAAGLYGVEYLRPEGYYGNLQVLQDATPYCGFFDNPTLDDDGVTRRAPLIQMFDGQVYPSLALALARLALGNPAVGFEFDPPEARGALNLERLRVGPAAAAVDARAAVMVPYRGPEGSFPYVSVADVLKQRVDAETLRGKLILLGTSAPGLKDLRVTPVAKAYSGVEVHANIISGLLDGRIKQKAPYYAGIETMLMFVIGLTLALGFSRLSPLGSAGLTIALLVAVTGLSFWLWGDANFIMPLGVPVVFTLLVFLGQLLYGYFIESRGKREISKLFGQYVPPELVEEMAGHPEHISMEGESREMTVLFSDVRNFTTISEKLDAKDLAAMMNAYLTKQTGVIQKYRGTIDKYIGDAIMAFWGAPLPDQDHARKGTLAAMAMVGAVRELDAEFEKRGWPRLNIGVGVNSGKMNVGNMGSEFRMAYTVMGDSVNLGSRLEGLTKEYGVPILVSQYTRDLLPSDWAFREVDLVRVKGRHEPVAIYEPMGPKEQLDPALRQDLARHRGAMKLYRAQKWDEAEQEFFNLKQSGRPHHIYDLFLERILFLRENPPGANWDGAFTFTHK